MLRFKWLIAVVVAVVLMSASAGDAQAFGRRHCRGPWFPGKLIVRVIRDVQPVRTVARGAVRTTAGVVRGAAAVATAPVRAVVNGSPRVCTPNGCF